MKQELFEVLYWAAWLAFIFGLCCLFQTGYPLWLLVVAFIAHS